MYSGPSGSYECDARETGGQRHYGDDEEISFQYEVEVHQGTALVFDNVQLVHRVRMLKNKAGDQQKRYRSFLAFFIVDPYKPIASTRDHPSLRREWFIRTIIEHTAINTEDIAALICDFASSGYTLEEAKELRELNIECRKRPSTKGRWGEIMFGNSGDRIWFKNGQSVPVSMGLPTVLVKKLTVGGTSV